MYVGGEESVGGGGVSLKERGGGLEVVPSNNTFKR